MNVLRRCRLLFSPKISSVNCSNSVLEKMKQEKLISDYQSFEFVSMNPDDLVTFLIKNIVYFKDGIVVTQKPLGVRVGEKTDEPLEEYDIFSQTSLKDVLPLMAERLGVRSLVISRSPPRCVSGVLVLVHTREAEMNMYNGLMRTRSLGNFGTTYLVVTIGTPINPVLSEINKPTSENDTLKQINFNVQGNMFLKWKTTVLSSSGYASLLKIMPNANTPQLMKYCALFLRSPILSCDVIRNSVCYAEPLMRCPILYPHLTSKGKQDLKKIFTRLEIIPSKNLILPHFVHLQKLHLRMDCNKRFNVSVPPPKSFLWCLEKLDLDPSYVYKKPQYVKKSQSLPKNF